MENYPLKRRKKENIEPAFYTVPISFEKFILEMMTCAKKFTGPWKLPVSPYVAKFQNTAQFGFEVI